MSYNTTINCKTQIEYILARDTYVNYSYRIHFYYRSVFATFYGVYNFRVPTFYTL